MSLCLSKYYVIQTFGGIDAEIHVFLTSALVGGDLSASRPAHFTSEKRGPSSHWTGDWAPVWKTYRGENSCPYHYSAQVHHIQNHIRKTLDRRLNVHRELSAWFDRVSSWCNSNAPWTGNIKWGTWMQIRSAVHFIWRTNSRNSNTDGRFSVPANIQ
jgi:hypothetical protein